MTTPQEIREKSFDKARSMFGGYDMATIDEYLDELANDFEAMQKENLVLKSKMKVLVDKIEEYRTNESALNQAILSAQKLSVQIENDARTRSANIVAEAEAVRTWLRIDSVDVWGHSWGGILAQEYALLQARLGFTPDQVRRLLLDGVAASWLPEPRRQQLADAFRGDPAWATTPGT